MSVGQNKQIVRDFFEALSNADVDRIVNAYSEDGTCWTAGSFPLSGHFNKAQIAEGSKKILGLFPDKLKFSIKAMTAEGERVAVEAESQGRHVSGKLYHNEYHFLFVIRDGKIVELREYLDTMHANDVLCGVG
jgi:ketosteroid isomerase-like protein